MSIADHILEVLSTPLSYKGMSVNILGLPMLKPYARKSINNTIFKLKKDGYVITTRNNTLHLSPSGKKYLKRKRFALKTFSSPFNKTAQKNLLVIYDIPEKYRAERDWFRLHLKKFNYEMIQRSVWVGPSPLPKTFMEYIQKIGLKNTLKTFRLARGYSNKPQIPHTSRS